MKGFATRPGSDPRYSGDGPQRELHDLAPLRSRRPGRPVARAGVRGVLRRDEPRRLRLRRRHPDVPGDRGDLGARRGRGQLRGADARTWRTPPGASRAGASRSTGSVPRSSRCRSMARATASSTVWSFPRPPTLRQSAHRSDDLRHRPRERRHRRSDGRRHLPARGRARLSAPRRSADGLLPRSRYAPGALRQHVSVGAAFGALPGGRRARTSQGERQRLGKGGVCGSLVAGDLRVRRRAGGGDEGRARRRRPAVLFLGGRPRLAPLAPSRTRRPHPLLEPFLFRLAGRDRGVQLEPLRQRLRNRLWQRGGQFHDAARRGAERAAGVAGEGGPLVLPGAVSFASRRAGLLAAGSRLRAGDSRGERALAAADLALLPVVRRRQLGAALPGAAPAAVDPARGGGLRRWRRGSGWRAAIVLAGRRQSRRFDGPIAGAVQRSRRAAPLVEATAKSARAGDVAGVALSLHALELLPQAVATTTAKLLGRSRTR